MNDRARGIIITLACALAAALVIAGPTSLRALRATRRADAAGAAAGVCSAGSRHGCCGPSQCGVMSLPDAESEGQKGYPDGEIVRASASAVEAAGTPVAVGVSSAQRTSAFPTLRELEVRLNT